MADLPAVDQDADANGRNALDRLRQREELLEICFWYQGEGLGSRLTPQLVMPFLNSDLDAIARAFETLVADGYFVAENGGYTLTALGKRKGGHMFTESFIEFQQPGHGECQDGCCDGDEPCAHNGGKLLADPSAVAVCGIEHLPGEPCAHPNFFRMRYRNG